MKINNLIALIRGICLGFIILSIILSTGILLKVIPVYWDLFYVFNSLAFISTLLGVKHEIKVRDLSRVEMGAEIANAIGQVLFVGGIISTLLSYGTKDYEVVLFIGGFLAALVGFVLLLISSYLHSTVRKVSTY